VSNKVSYLFIAQDKYSRVAKKINRQTRIMRWQFKRLQRRFRVLGKSTDKMGRRISSRFKQMASAAALFFGAKHFLTVGGKFQDSLADLSAITGATGKDLGLLKGNIQSLAKESATSADQVAEAFKLVGSAKPELLNNVDALSGMTKEVLLLKNASGIELASAAKITAESLNIFGKDASQASAHVNILAAGAKLGSSEIRDTGAAMLIAGPRARAAGLSFLQLNAAIQTTARGGIKGSQAGTALSAIFGRVERAGADFKKLGLQETFEIIKRKMDSLKTSTQRANFASQIFGEEHSKVGFALLGNVKMLGKFENTLGGTNIAQEQANIRMNTFNTRARRTGIIINDVLIRAFTKLEPKLSQVADDLSDFFGSLDSKDIDAFVGSMEVAIDAARVLATALMVVFGILKMIGTAIGEVTAAVATLDFSSFSDSTKELGNILWSLSVPGLAERQLNFLFGDDDDEVKAPDGGPSKTDINLNVNAPAGVVGDIKSKTSGGSNMNVGVNMKELFK